MKPLCLYLKQVGLYLYQKGLAAGKAMLARVNVTPLSQKLTIPKQYRVDIGHPDRVPIRKCVIRNRRHTTIEVDVANGAIRDCGRGRQIQRIKRAVRHRPR